MAGTTGGVTNVTFQTVASYGHQPHPDWVSYLVKNPQGEWVHSTVVQVPAHSLVRFTIYNYDGASGLRNPLWSQPRGTVGGTETINGKPYAAIDPTLTSHTFAIPDMGVSVALPGVADDAPNQCSVTPCQLSMAHYHHHLHDPHRQARPLPLAVLRPLRRRVPQRLRRSHANGWLDGRLPQCRLTGYSDDHRRDRSRPRPAPRRRRLGGAVGDRRAARDLRARAAHAARQRHRPGPRAARGEHHHHGHPDADRDRPAGLLRLRADRVPAARRA